MQTYVYKIEAFLPDKRRIASWHQELEIKLLPETVKIYQGALIRLVKKRVPKFKDEDIKIKISLDGKEINAKKSNSSN